MDTSRRYIEMCQKADELQELKRSTEMIESGDWFAVGDVVVPVVDGGHFYGEKKWIVEYQAGWECEDTIMFLPDDYTWLPVQCQLQDMMPNTDVYRLFNQLGAYGERTGNEHSPEELTLKYVMKVVYGKDWNGCEWV